MFLKNTIAGVRKWRRFYLRSPLHSSLYFDHYCFQRCSMEL